MALATSLPRGSLGLSSRIQDDLGQGFAGRLFNTVIREGTAVGQSQYAKQPLAVYAPTSSPAKDYEALDERFGGGGYPGGDQLGAGR